MKRRFLHLIITSFLSAYSIERPTLIYKGNFAGHTKVFAKAGLDNVTLATCSHWPRLWLTI